MVSDKIISSLQAAVSIDEIVELEKRLIGIPSYTLEETPLAEFIVQFLRSQGVEASLQEVPAPEPSQPATSRRASHNVVGVLRGDGSGPRLMFNGHMDINATDLAVGGTAFTGYTGWKRHPFTPVVEDGRIYGKGAYDEKGGVCAFLAAAVAIQRAGLKPKGDIYFCPVMGHYSASAGTKHLMKLGLRADYGICSENSGSWIVPAHNGGILAEAHVRGVNPGTRYSLPETMDKATAFANAVRFVNALGVEGVPHRRDGWTAFKPHAVLREFPNHRIGYINTVAKALDHIVVGVLIKTVPGMDENSCRLDLERVLAGLEKEYADFIGGKVVTTLWAPPLDTAFDSPVVAALSAAYAWATGEKAQVGIEARLGAMGDSGCMAASGIETCIFGPGIMHDRDQLRGVVPPDECISVKELVDAAHTMALAAVALSC